MCRLFALVAERSRSPELPDLMRHFRELSRQHPDGWGFGWFFDGRPQVEKSPAAAFYDPRFMTTCISADSNIVMAHIRTSGGTPLAPENTHPFSYGTYIFEHDGSVRMDLAELMPNEYSGRIQGQTDSEQLFYWILYNIDRMGSIVRGIREAVKPINESPEASEFSFILSDGQAVYSYRSSSCREDRHSILYRVRKETDKYPGRSVIISSQRLGRGEWHAIDTGTLLVVNKLRNIEEHKFSSAQVE
ncbi:MAG TPA: class II glutamine amidotransferase [Euryarchaeota archaeon]|nr:class II glutamine amidotransferase [Euryarchaeota archaeon]